jgi:type III secretory pathway component EscV
LLRTLAGNADKAIAKVGDGATPCIVTPPDLRRYVRAIMERKLPNVVVASFREVDPSVPLRVVERLSA